VCSVGDPVATGCGCQHRKCDISATPACFQAGPSLRVAAKHEKWKWFVMEPIEGEGGKRWAKMFLTSASPERTDQRQSFSRPNLLMICGPILRMCRHVKVGVWGCARGIVCSVQTWHSVSPRFPSNLRTNSESKGNIGIRKNQAFPWCAQVGKQWGGCKVMPWGTYLATLPEEGVTQWWGQPIILLCCLSTSIIICIHTLAICHTVSCPLSCGSCDMHVHHWMPLNRCPWMSASTKTPRKRSPLAHSTQMQKSGMAGPPWLALLSSCYWREDLALPFLSELHQVHQTHVLITAYLNFRRFNLGSRL